MPCSSPCLLQLQKPRGRRSFWRRSALQLALAVSQHCSFCCNCFESTLLTAPGLTPPAPTTQLLTSQGKSNGTWTQHGVLWFLVAAAPGRDRSGACAVVSHQLACYQAFMTHI